MRLLRNCLELAAAEARTQRLRTSREQVEFLKTQHAIKCSMKHVLQISSITVPKKLGWSTRVALTFVKLYVPWPPKYSATHTGTCCTTLTCTYNSILLGGASHLRCTVHTLCSPLCNNNSKKPLKHQIKISNFIRPVATIQICTPILCFWIGGV